MARLAVIVTRTRPGCLTRQIAGGYAGSGVSGRHRVRGKDRVLLKWFLHLIASMNSFLPEGADNGRNG